MPMWVMTEDQWYDTTVSNDRRPKIQCRKGYDRRPKIWCHRGYDWRPMI